MSAEAASRPVGAMRKEPWHGARPSSIIACLSVPTAPAPAVPPALAAPVGSARRTRTCAGPTTAPAQHLLASAEQVAFLGS